MPFRFPLQTLLRYRHGIEQQRELRLHEAAQRAAATAEREIRPSSYATTLVAERSVPIQLDLRGHRAEEVTRIILTGSGGPCRDAKDLGSVTVEQALEAFRQHHTGLLVGARGAHGAGRDQVDERLALVSAAHLSQQCEPSAGELASPSGVTRIEENASPF